MAKRTGIDPSADTAETVQQLKLKNKCESDSCLFDIYFSDDNWNNIFKPAKDSYSELITDEDIDNIFVQVMRKYPWLYVVSPVFSDMKPFTSDYELSLTELRARGKKAIGIVINHDVHTGSGTHWVSVYMDITNVDQTNVYYFDSFGKSPPKILLGWFKQMAERQKKEGHGTTFYVNRTVHQSLKSVQCGVYAVNFITSMAEGASFEEFVNRKIDESMIMRLRWDKYLQDKHRSAARR